jgi:3',5'-cyclic AMP phosphodiesterase CpdA
LEDLELKLANGADYDGLLITGDIAYGGKQDQYKRAQQWLDEVFDRAGVSPNNTYMVPGNHDVDRDYVQPEFPLWDSHVRLRETADPVVWRWPSFICGESRRLLPT